MEPAEVHSEAASSAEAPLEEAHSAAEQPEVVPSVVALPEGAHSAAELLEAAPLVEELSVAAVAARLEAASSVAVVAVRTGSRHEESQSALDAATLWHFQCESQPGRNPRPDGTLSAEEF